MRIHLKNVNGEFVSLEVKGTDTIESIKERYQDIVGIPTCRQGLVYSGEMLKDTHTLDYYKIHDEIVLELIVYQKVKFKINVKSSLDKDLILDVDTWDTIKKVKEMIQEKESIPTGMQRLVYHGTESTDLEDEKTLLFYKIRQNYQISLYFNQSGSLQIFVKSSVYVLYINSSDKFLDIVHKFDDNFEKRNADNRLVSLIVEQEKEEGTMSDFNIQKENALHLVFHVLISFKRTPVECSEHCHEIFGIIVKTISGRTFEIQVYSNTVTEEIKYIIYVKISIPPDEQRLLQRGGRELQNGLTLSDYNIRLDNDNTIFVFARIPSMWIFVRVSSGKTYDMVLHVTDHISMIKERMYDKEGIPPHIQRILFREKVVDDERTLSDFNIGNHETFDLCIIPKDTFDIFVILPSKDKVSISVYLTDSIEDLKRKIREKTDMLQYRLELSYGGNVLEDTRILSYYNIQKGNNLVVQAIPLFKLCIVTSFGKQISFEVDDFSTIIDVKNMIQKKEIIPISIQRLVYLNNSLEDHRTLSYYKINKDDTLFLDVSISGGLDLFVKRREELSATIKINYMDTIDDVKACVYKETGIVPMKQRLYLGVIQLREKWSALHAVTRLYTT